MSRKRRKATVHGWLVLDKPLGLSSNAALGRVKRLFDCPKAGHAGTLDPLASGLLPVALGEATKTVPWIVDEQKTYRFEAVWGVRTTTDDAEGEPEAVSESRPTLSQIDVAMKPFSGEITQIPPRFSAIHVDGKRAYVRARGGEDVEMPARQVEIHALTRHGDNDESGRYIERTVFDCTCGKGTYIRALARDLGEAMGCHAHVGSLRRLRVGPFREVDMVTLEALESAAAVGPAALAAHLRPVEAALPGMTRADLGAADAAALSRGQAVLLRGRDAPVLAGPVLAMHEGAPVAICEGGAGQLVPRRVFRFHP